MDTVNFQSLFNFAVAVAGTVFGWFMKTLQDQIKEAKDAAKAAQEAVNTETSKLRDRQDSFALKEDVKDGFNRLEVSLNRLFHLVEKKMDKP